MDAGIALEGAAVVVAALLLFEGGRRVVVARARHVALGLIAVGTLLCAAFGGGPYHQYRRLAEIERVSQLRAELPDGWGSDMAPAARREASLDYARAIFLATGELRNYFDHTGARILYVPTAGDIEKRASWIAEQEAVRTLFRESRRDTFLWFFTLLFGLGFGVALGIARRPTDGTAESDVRKDSGHGSP